MWRANAKRPRVTANKMPRTRLKLLKKWLSCLLMGAKYIRQFDVGEKTGAPDWIRTNDLQLRRLPLYPAELRARGGADSSRLEPSFPLEPYEWPDGRGRHESHGRPEPPGLVGAGNMLEIHAVDRADDRGRQQEDGHD